MKTPEIFAMIVRTLGLIVCLIMSVILFAGLVDLFGGGPGNHLARAFFALPLLFLGPWMLRGAPGLIAFAYSEEKQLPRNPQELVDWLTSGKNP